MTRPHRWFLVALTVGCSSESPSDEMDAVTAVSPTASQTTPVQATTPPPPTGNNTTPPAGSPGGLNPVPPMTAGPSGSPPPATVTNPAPGPIPMPGSGGSGGSGGTGGTGGTDIPAIPGSGGDGGMSAGGEGGAAGSTTAVGGTGGSGGAAAGGAPVNEAGGAPAEGGAPGAAGAEGSGECTIGTTSGNEVVFIGESFIAASSIPEETTNLARENGSLPQGESYLDFSVSGTRLGDGAIPRQYEMAAASNPIRFVLMNGGGNDCLQANDPNSPIPAAEALYEQMAADGVEKVVYFFYPDAAGMFGGPSSSLQTCLNEYRPKIKAVCDALTAPKCYWLDLAETSWAGNESAYTSDGIHPNAEGSRVTAEAIWETMVENCVAQ